jgi:hypothetical protein
VLQALIIGIDDVRFHAFHVLSLRLHQPIEIVARRQSDKEEITNDRTNDKGPSKTWPLVVSGFEVLLDGQQGALEVVRGASLE